MELHMKKNVKIILLPEDSQVQLLIDTIDRYCVLCNYISKILFRLYTDKPINKFYINLVSSNRDLQIKVHHLFPDININFIKLALKRVSKYYKYREMPSEAYVYSNILDCNSHLISISKVIQPKSNLRVITIHTLLGPQEVRFTFNDASKEDIDQISGRLPYREYTLTYKKNKFYLSTIINNEQIVPRIRSISFDHLRKGKYYL